ncbi:hypothetical protein L1049_018864 [Liquidambar formosana]|uniref:MI domain-containing protein n=1 Tax=Liquidambar formosana TaxID=63359 RepID=A0AAP0RAP4_LIQFO
MSLNQSRSEKNESQFRKSGRSGSYGSQQRSFSGKGGGSGGGTAHPPATSLSSNRSFKKSNNAQGGHPRINVSTVNSESGNASTTPHSVQNGAHVLPPLHGASDGPVAGVAAKPIESSSTQKSNRAVPKAPSSQSSTVSCDATAPTTPAKAPGDASRPFALQFGSISPGFMNGMQIPARTNSAPPNLDEQKRDQARPDSFISVPTLPIPSVPKQQLPRKDVGAVDQSNTVEAHPMPKAKKDVHVTSAPASTQTQKPSVLPMAGISMQMPFHHPQVPLQFGGPNPHPQIQSHGMTPTSLQMPLPMPLPMGNASQVQQQVFVSSLQHHPMQPQAIMHQGQSLSFTTQMGPQLAPQLGNMGISIPPPFPQQQAGKFGAPRKAVKITHPDTHEELRLDDASLGPRSHSNVPPQSQPIASFTPGHSLNYYANSVQCQFHVFPSSKFPDNSQFSGSETGAPITGTTELPNLEYARDVHNVISSAPTGTVQVSVKPSAGSIGDKVTDSSLSISSHAVGKESSLQQPKPGKEVLTSMSVPVASKQSAGAFAAASVESLVSNTLSSASIAPSEESTLVLTNTEGRRRETLSRSNSMKDHQKKPGKKGHTQQQYQEAVKVCWNLPVNCQSTIGDVTLDASELRTDSIREGSICVPPEVSAAGNIIDTLDAVRHVKQDDFKMQDGQLKHETVRTEEQEKTKLLEEPKQNSSSLEISSESISPKVREVVKQTKQDSVLKATNVSNEIGSSETSQRELDEPRSCPTTIDRLSDNLMMSTSTISESIINAEASTSSIVSSTISHGVEASTLNSSSSISDCMGSEETAVTKSGISDQDSALVSTPYLPETTLKNEGEGAENNGGVLVSPLASDRRGSGMVDDDKWSKLAGHFAPGRDLRLDIGHGGNLLGFRPGQGGNYGVLRNPRVQTPIQYPGGILSGPMQSMGPKKIEEVHRDAAQERQAQSSRLTRGPGSNSSVRRGPPMDFGPRGSTMLSPSNAQMAGFRGIPTQVRGYGNQDVRLEERQLYEARTLSVPLPQRPVGDDPITLGPQGGLARGMSIRGPASMSTLADIPPSPADSRRMTAGLNGYSSVSERTTYSSREELMPRFNPERFVSSSAYEQSSGQERNVPYGNRDSRNLDRSFDRSLATSPPTRVQGPSFTQNVSSEKVWPEEHLRNMSIAAIKEFYSAKDEKEVALCIKDLNSPSFYPSMISLWIIDSFERKDMERDLLAKLLVNLAKPQDGMLTQVHLMKGFDSVLTTLEDAVNDAPKAAEFLGCIFAKVILENAISLGDIGQLIHRGGEEPGRLLKIGLAGDVLGSILERIQSDKGESVLKEIRSSSDLQVEDFRPPDPITSRKLEKFI